MEEVEICEGCDPLVAPSYEDVWYVFTPFSMPDNCWFKTFISQKTAIEIYWCKGDYANPPKWGIIMDSTEEYIKDCVEKNNMIHTKIICTEEELLEEILETLQHIKREIYS